MGPNYIGRYFFAGFVQGRVWSLALTIDSATGEARASDLTDHTAELGASGAVGNVSSFGTDADGELYVVSYSGGAILKVFGLASAPATPTGLRIIIRN
jgi:hypothetical protein